MTELNTGGALESTPRISANGLVMYFNRGTVGNCAIYRTTRNSRTAPWSSPTLVSELSTAAEDYGASAEPGELRIVFNSDRDGQPMGDKSGMARLVVPGDKRGGRYVSTVKSIELKDPGPAPQ